MCGRNSRLLQSHVEPEEVHWGGHWAGAVLGLSPLFPFQSKQNQERLPAAGKPLIGVHLLQRR